MLHKGQVFEPGKSTRRVVLLGYQHDVDWYDHIITWNEDGKLIEAKSAHESTKADAKETLKATMKWAKDDGYEVGLTSAAQKLLDEKPRRRKPKITFGKEPHDLPGQE